MFNEWGNFAIPHERRMLLEMKSKPFILILFFCIQAALIIPISYLVYTNWPDSGHWTKVGTHSFVDTPTYYVDLQSLKRQGDKMYYWELTDFNTGTRPVDDWGDTLEHVGGRYEDAIYSMKRHHEADCGSFKIRILSVSFYETQMALGTPQYTINDPPNRWFQYDKQTSSQGIIPGWLLDARDWILGLARGSGDVLKFVCEQKPTVEGNKLSFQNFFRLKPIIKDNEFSPENLLRLKQSANGNTQQLFHISGDKEVLLKTVHLPDSIAMQSKDINNDGINEILMTESSKGNCCSPTLSFYYLNNQNDLQMFKFENWEAWSGWDDIEFKISGDHVAMTNIRKNSGINTNLNWTKVSYTYDGIKVSDALITKIPEMKSISEIRSSQFEMQDKVSDQLALTFDLNADEEAETIICEYWERWGSFSTCNLSSPNNEISQVFPDAGKRIGVLAEKRNGWHMLVSDHSDRWSFDNALQKYTREK